MNVSAETRNNYDLSKMSERSVDVFRRGVEDGEQVTLGIFLERDDQLQSFSGDSKKRTVRDVRNQRRTFLDERSPYIQQEVAKHIRQFPENVEIQFISEILPFVVVKANYRDAIDIVKLPFVKHIEIYEDYVEIEDLSYTHHVTNQQDYGYLDESSLIVDYNDTTMINQVKQTYSVDGEDIWLGFLESGVLDHSHPELSSKSVIKSTTGTTNPHATLTSIIAAGTSNGVAPEANIISIEVTTNAQSETTPSYIFSDLEDLVIMGADVINVSFGVLVNGEYDSFSRYVDAIINETKVIVVIAAGNGSHYDFMKQLEGANEFVNAFGLAQNAITVGATTADGEKICSYSSFETTYDSLPYGTESSKPTIVAPGGDAYTDTFIDSNGSVLVFSVRAPLFVPNSPYKVSDPNYNDAEEDVVAQINHTGTSFSAPIVTGAIALLLEYKPSLMFEPERVMSILTASADYNLLYVNEEEYNTSTNQIEIATSHNGYSYSPDKGLNEYSGAGLLNLSEAFKIAQNGNYFYFTSVTGNTGTVFSKQLVFEEGDYVQISLAFLRNIEGTSSSVDNYSFDDYDLELYKGSTLIRKIDSSTSNVEKFFVDIPSDGVYTIIVKLKSKGSAPGNSTTYRGTEISVAIDSTEGYSFYIPSC